MTKLTPTLEELSAVGASAPSGPITIVNLLRFKPGSAAREAYSCYRRAAHQAAAGQNPHVLHSGPALANFGTGERWDWVIIARYPSFDDFARKTGDPLFQGEAAAHRPAALEATVMLASSSGDLDSYLDSGA